MNTNFNYFIDKGNDWNNDGHCDIEGWFVDDKGHHRPVIRKLGDYKSYKVLHRKYLPDDLDKCLVGNGKFGEHFSEKGCKYIDSLNEKNGWHLIHAKNGGEKQVCGYFLDGYDEELNIAFEYDEPKHYVDVYNSILCERDIKRQNEIINELGCKFYRYNEKIDKLYVVN